MKTKIYYLRSDRSITENIDDPERVDGTTKTVYIEAETEAEMYEEAANQFKANSYNHSVSAKFLIDSKLYDTGDLYVGRRCKILSESAGVKESIITAVSRSDSSNYIAVTFGNLPVTLTRKIRREMR
ncbi:hypothetical protein DWX10_17025 [Clostridium sp. AF18-27]|uniref:hypothetical protein n=1 Tax=Enterocloster lavalensis TaxID=460384 RepID=UPI000E5504EF|nr:hypothetical protein [Enterocloster lavalensis]RHR52114.1 hypothetical protein DWX10_17025 [Clostridium sp. AF18-27]